MKKFGIALALLVWAAAAQGQEAGGPEKPLRFGVGVVFNDRAPLSTRVWFSPNVGLDVGLGVRARRVDDITTVNDSTPFPTKRVSLVDLSFDLGVPVNVLRYEKVNFVVRPGFGLRTRADFFFQPSDPRVRSIETGVDLEFNASAGFEYFPTRRASFSLLAGFALIAERPGGVGETIMHFESLPSGKGVNWAFRFYVL